MMPCPDGRDCLLGWRSCRGEWPVLRPGIKSGAASAEGRVRGKPRNQSGAGSRRASGTGPTPGRSRGADLCDACGVGRSGMEARRGAGGGGSDPHAGRCLVKRSARASSRKKATTQGPSRALRRPVCLTSRQPCLGHASAGPLSGQGRG